MNVCSSLRSHGSRQDGKSGAHQGDLYFRQQQIRVMLMGDRYEDGPIVVSAEARVFWCLRMNPFEQVRLHLQKKRFKALCDTVQ